MIQDDPYIFSEESLPYLAKFLKIVRKAQVGQAANKNGSWSIYLPQNEEVIKRIEQHISEDIIDITEENSAVDHPTISNETTIDTKSNSLCEDVYDINLFIKTIQSQLENKNCLEQSTLETLTALSFVKGELIFKELKHCIDTSVLCNFGIWMLNMHDINENVVSLFCRHIFMPMLEERDSEDITALFDTFIKRHSHIISDELSTKLLNMNEGCTNSLPDMFNSLEVSMKQKVLSNFTMNCRNLESSQFMLLSNLITENMDLPVLKKLIELLLLYSIPYSASTDFGKLIYNVVQSAKSNINYFQEELNHLIENHQTCWRARAKRIYDKNISEKEMFSLTMNF